MIKIITDSTSDIDLSYAKERDIQVVPLKVMFDGTTYHDRVDLLPAKFYELLANSPVLPTTSQPSPQDYLNLYEQVKADGDTAIVLTLSSKISGTYQSACIAKELCEYENIHIIDTLNATLGLRLIVEKAIKLREEGMNALDMVSFLEEYKNRVKILAYVDTLEYFYKGGRLSKSSVMIGSMLKLKPVVGLKDGVIGVFAKGRGSQKATAQLLKLIAEDGGIDPNEPIGLGFTGDDTGMDKFEATIRETFDINEIHYAAVGPVVGTHAGPGGRVLAYVKKVR